ncbi:hypothetical protein AVEN_62949-1 [Araneus ventricosus]|uniref:Uncharacterized protein n=1 Tax=Araneus ventricosus TaxID=182803 RepID=A0A4Y2PBU7_ARAVE|nr:hypothetical protein AVEN_223612-1 [Araneus ventricosus]GBN47960.1 hypothetical protein AVEN_62949-1 [Araneus ventricosus]
MLKNLLPVWSRHQHQRPPNMDSTSTKVVTFPHGLHIDTWNEKDSSQIILCINSRTIRPQSLLHLRMVFLDPEQSKRGTLQNNQSEALCRTIKARHSAEQSKRGTLQNNQSEALCRTIKARHSAEQSKRGTLQNNQSEALCRTIKAMRSLCYAFSLQVSCKAASRDWSNGKNNSPSSCGLRESHAFITADITGDEDLKQAH